jgi:hypothetical protein
MIKCEEEPILEIRLLETREGEMLGSSVEHQVGVGEWEGSLSGEDREWCGCLKDGGRRW